MVNGCKRRAVSLKTTLKNFGEPIILIATSDTFPYFSHESGSLFNYHHVVLLQGLVYDPNYTGGVPIPLQDYVGIAYPDQDDVILWRKGVTDRFSLDYYQ